MKLTRTVALFALLLPAVLAAQGAASQPTAAQLKARAELARQRALQQQTQQTKTAAPATKTATPSTGAATPQTKGAPAVVQSKTPATVPQTKTVTPPAPQTKTATTPAGSAPQTKTAAAPPPVPQTKTAAAPTTTTTTTTKAPAGAVAAGQTGTPRLQPAAPAEVTFSRETFSYAKANRRDPFVSMITSSDLRPQISDLKLVTVIHSTIGSASVAIMRDLTTKEQYRVRVGQTLGRMRVAQIQPRAVVFSIEEFGYNRQEVVSMDDSTRARTP